MDKRAIPNSVDPRDPRETQTAKCSNLGAAVAVDAEKVVMDAPSARAFDLAQNLYCENVLLQHEYSFVVASV
jgi:hypothetical protein